MYYIILTIEYIMYVIMLITVLYFVLFAAYSMLTKTYPIIYDITKTDNINRIAVLFPCYREDAVIEESVKSFLLQEYPKELYDIVVISDDMQQHTNTTLSKLPIILLKAEFENSLKAKAMNLAIDTLPKELYNIVVVMDADNSADPDFLKKINIAYNSGIRAMQAHRIAKNIDTDVSVLDAVSEEINNAIFREGHVNMGLSSALIGSGMAFDYKWFADNIKKVYTAGEDKELEMLLLKNGIYINYLRDVKVYDHKVQNSSAFYHQRRRWLAAQFNMLALALKDIPNAMYSKNIDYIDKIFQWMLLPRIVVLGIILFFSIALLFIDWVNAIKWWGLLLILIFALCVAIPDYLVDIKFYKAMRKLPLLGFMMLINFFRLRGGSEKFIHTKHS